MTVIALDRGVVGGDKQLDQQGCSESEDLDLIR